MISDCKRGSIKAGSTISSAQERRLRLLVDDLGLRGARRPIASMVGAIAAADSTWNRRTMAVMIGMHDASRQDRRSEVEALRAAFVRECPSAWYRDIVMRA